MPKPSSSDRRKPYQKIRHPVDDPEQTELYDFETPDADDTDTGGSTDARGRRDAG